MKENNLRFNTSDNRSGTSHNVYCVFRFQNVKLINGTSEINPETNEKRLIFFFFVWFSISFV